jgi:hypothetical protein
VDDPVEQLAVVVGLARKERVFSNLLSFVRRVDESDHDTLARLIKERAAVCKILRERGARQRPFDDGFKEKKLKFFEDYGKGYKADPPPDPKLFEPEPGEIEWRMCFIPALPATLPPRTRQIVKSYEMTNLFRPKSALVLPTTPETVILHSTNLVRPMPLVHVFGLDNDDSWGLRNMRQEVIGRFEKKPGETIDFDLENTGDEPVEIKIVISGLAKVPPAAKKVCCRVLDGLAELDALERHVRRTRGEALVEDDSK